MKKAIVSSIVGLLCGSLLSFAPTSVTAEEATTITYGIWDSNQEPGLRKIADEFEKQNPGIKVDIQVTGWDGYWTMLEAAATGGSLPDVFWMHSNEIFKYGSNDMLLDLTSYIEKDNVDLTKFPEGLVKIYNVKEKQYALPKDFDTIGLWYNKKMFDEAGLEYPNSNWTWEDLKAAAEKLTKKDGSQYGISAPLINQEGYYNFVYQNGGTILTEDRKSGYDLKETIEAIDYYFSFVNDGQSFRTYKDADARAQLENGMAAMGVFGSWQLPAFLDNEYLSENFDVAELPSKDGKKASIYNGLGNAISANTEHPEEAWKFVKFLSGEEGQKMQAELGVAISAYEGTADLWANTHKNFNLQAYIDMVQYGPVRPYTDNTTVWEEKAYEILQSAYTGEKTAEEACKEVAEAMNQFISQE
ncbi:ABC transporter substrate-binding protein [Tuanshanicoccus yangjingiae]|uniref:ABC transporter substrate-binding protein n=1 Tax=Aerococcaceae bacterium zg-252 TaxID=2796928 RepID=UPI004063AB8C